MPYFSNITASEKQDGSLLTAADLAMQQTLAEKLKEQWPDYEFFSEELSAQEQMQFLTHEHDAFWCLDPLDGTTNFSWGLPYFAVSLALIRKQQAVFGLVYDPVRDECFTAIKGQGAWLNDQPLKPHREPAQLSNCIANVDFKRLPEALAYQLASRAPYRSQRSFGAAALDWCWLAAGRCQLFLHGKQMLWDHAAGNLIAHEAGCVSSDLQGGPVFEISLNKRQVVAAVNETLYIQWFKYVKQTG